MGDVEKIAMAITTIALVSVIVVNGAKAATVLTSVKTAFTGALRTAEAG